MYKLLIIVLFLGLAAAGCNPGQQQNNLPNNNDQPVHEDTVQPDSSLEDVNFSKTGNIKNWDEKTETFTDNWTFVYEAPGEPAKSANMALDQESICRVGEENFDCRELLNKDFNGERVHLQGALDGDIVKVKLITF